MQSNQLQSAQITSHEDALQFCIVDICRSIGFNYVNARCLNLLNQKLIHFFLQVGLNASNYCELTRRTDPTFVDVLKSLSALNIDISKIDSLIKQNSKSTCSSYQACSPIFPKILSVGKKQPHSSFIPDNLPPFPDPHTYLSTPATNTSDIPYSQQRENMAIQKRNATESLIQYALRVHRKTDLSGELISNIFVDELPLIPPYPSEYPYLTALVPNTLSTSSPRNVKRKSIKLSDIDFSVSINPFLRPPKRKRMKLRLCLDLN